MWMKSIGVSMKNEDEKSVSSEEEIQNDDEKSVSSEEIAQNEDDKSVSLEECSQSSNESKTDKEARKEEAPRAKGRMFQITTEEAKDLPNVVSGIFSLNLMPTYVLFDTGASRSFVSSELVSHPSFRIERMHVPLEVEIADSKSYLLHEVCRNCEIIIEDETFAIDLIPMVLGEFKVIVGMDWLAKHHAEIQCEKKVIHVLTPRGKRVSIQGERNIDSKLCSIVQAYKYVRNGSKAFLAYVVDTKQNTPKIEEIEVVNEFLDVFSEDLPGLPPERKVDFKIELYPDAKPVAKAPYRLAPTEMRELMFKLGITSTWYAI
ncbi:uncharacterized protein LOC110901496 [Helianthus annuus]|uniref:uncharacterized protein LOC110901496 n=1 Tax=Helianthus annuus TaxID=4232 RepID=UPI000B8EF36D|nr:uncharacterized protein LOC110901496 [Helianthus annuus]